MSDCESKVHNPENSDNEEQLKQMLDFSKLPHHVAIIMDGNGRWAVNRGLSRSEGHRAGVKSLKKIVELCVELKIKILTVYAFSSENWKRPQEEIDVLMELLVEYLYSEIEELDNNNVQVKPIGRIHELPNSAQLALQMAVNKTADNDGLILNIALNYGGRMELVDAIKKIVKDVNEGKIDINSIREETVSKYLYTAGMRDPDLLVRPSGDFRVSNYLLWQLAYTEFWPTSIMWPDFSRVNLLEAIIDYQNRERRFGGLLHS